MACLGRAAGQEGGRAAGHGHATAGLERRGWSSRTELSEVLALGPGRVRREVARVPRLGPQPSPSTPILVRSRSLLVRTGLRLVPSMVPPRRAATTGFLKFPPSPARKK